MTTPSGLFIQLHPASGLQKVLKSAKCDIRTIRKHTSTIKQSSLVAEVLGRPDDSDCKGATLEFKMPNDLSYTAVEFCDLCSQSSSSDAWLVARSGCEQDGSARQPIPVMVDVTNAKAVASSFKPLAPMKRKAAQVGGSTGWRDHVGTLLSSRPCSAADLCAACACRCRGNECASSASSQTRAAGAGSERV